MRKQCSFRLDLLVRTAAAPPARGANASAPGGPGSETLDAKPQLALAAGDMLMNGTLASPNCGLALRLGAATTHVQAYFAKAVNYTLMITALSFVQARARAWLACARACAAVTLKSITICMLECQNQA